MAGFKLLDVQWPEHSFLSFLGQIFTSNECRIMVSNECNEASRAECDGIIHAVGWVGTRLVGVAFNDFRVNGGSFGSVSARRSNAFFRLMSDSETPVILVLNTLGVRFMEGRTVFQDTFSMIPEIARFAEKNPLITISTGRTLGLGAILFGIGHYRMAVRGDSLINLTGPEVINLFFGKGFDYAALASAEKQFQTTNLVHELVESRDEALNRSASLLKAVATLQLPKDVPSLSSDFEGEYMDSDLLSTSGKKLQEILASFNGGTMEVYPNMSSVVRTYIAVHDGQLVGVFANPPGHSGNMINSRALDKYEAALNFFRSLKLPIVSFVDTSGAEPRTMGREADLLGKFINVASKIINYPFAKMGFIVGRCYGGATVLVFPKNFGGKASFALEGSRVGIMHEDIIAKLLNGSARLLEKWQETSATQTPDLKDLIAKGSVDELIKHHEISAKLSGFLQSGEEVVLEESSASLLQLNELKKRGAV